MTAYRALDLFSRSQLVRGGVLVALGIAALQWPDAALPASMAAAALLVVSSGAYDVYVGAASRREFRGWLLLAGHGAACIAFGILTGVLTRVPQDFAMLLVALWVALYGSMTAALSLALWPMRRTRWTLLAVTVVLVPVGLVAMTLGDMPQLVPLYLGAGFAVFLGAVHLAGGLWLRRIAMPQFAPTLQAGWAPPAGPAGAPITRGG